MEFSGTLFAYTRKLSVSLIVVIVLEMIDLTLFQRIFTTQSRVNDRKSDQV